MKNVAGAYVVGMPRVAVIQAAFAIPVFESCNTLTATHRCSIIYAPFLKTTKRCHFHLFFGVLSPHCSTVSVSVKKELSLWGRTRIRIF